MGYILIPVTGGSGSGSEAAMPGFIINIITSIILSMFVTERFLPNLHGWGRFFLCLGMVILFNFLSMCPYVGIVICLAVAIFWIVGLFSLTAGIGTIWIKWAIRIIVGLLILLSEVVVGTSCMQ